MAEENAIDSVFDFSADISSQEAPPPMPKGKYLASITSAVPKVSANTGNTYVDVTFTISPDQFPPDFAQVQSDAVNLHHRTLVIKDDARSRYNIRRFCEAVRAPVGRKLDLNDFLGKTALLTIDHRQYQGADLAEIKQVEAA